VLRAASAPRKPGTAIGNGSSDEQVGQPASFKFNIRTWRDAVDEADAARAQARRDLDEENAALPGKIRGAPGSRALADRCFNAGLKNYCLVKKKNCTFHLRSDSVYPMQGARVLILSGKFKGEEGVCLSKGANSRCAVSPDRSDEILSLAFESEFALLVDLSGDPRRN
jgi:hypothetical protein